MPACYGGGINTIEKAKKVISAGFEKIAISSRALVDLAFLKELVRQFGAQSIVVVIDLKLSKGKYSIYTHNGKVLIKKDFLEVFDEISKYAGEVVINSIDNDGKMAGYDLFLASLIK